MTKLRKVKGSDLAKSNSVVINAPATAEVIINIDGVTGDKLQNMGISLNNLNRQKVVYNFYEATDLTINGVQVDGTVYAPRAAVNFSNGTIKGSLIAKSVSGSSARFENFPSLVALP